VTTRKTPVRSATHVEPVDLQLLAKQLDRVVGTPASGRLLEPLLDQLDLLGEARRSQAEAVADPYVSLAATPERRSPDIAPASPLDLVDAAPIGEIVVAEIDVRTLDLGSRAEHRDNADPGAQQRFLLRAHRCVSPTPIWR
jgi:hypothetical protein